MNRNYDQEMMTTYRASYRDYAKDHHGTHRATSYTTDRSKSNVTRWDRKENRATHHIDRSGTEKYTTERSKRDVTTRDRKENRATHHIDRSGTEKSERQGHRSRHGHTGLDNLGNTCAMNSVLQALVHTKRLRNYFLDGEFNKDLKGRRENIATEIAHVMIEVWSGDHHSFAPRDIKRLMDRNEPRFEGHSQQDAQELLLYILEELHKELNTAQVNHNERLERLDGGDMEEFEKKWLAHLERNDSIVSELFEGQLKGTVTCQKCSRNDVQLDPFMILQLPLSGSTRQHVATRGRSGAESRLASFVNSVGSDTLLRAQDTRIVSLDDCFKLFLQPETLHKEDRWYCQRCQSYQVATLQMYARILPSILILQLRRFSMQGHVKHKNRRSVRFPLRDFSPYYVGHDQTFLHQSIKYDLYAVINHHGGTSGGHYTAFVRCSNDSDISLCASGWHLYDDNTVSPASDTDVLRGSASSAYLLFYHAQ